MLFGVTATGRLVAAITDTRLTMQSEMKINSLSESLINEIDASGDGQVTELEFVLYMLRKYELVDEGLLQGFFDNFRSLDTDGSGVLTADDLRYWANQNSQLRSRSPLRDNGYAELSGRHVRFTL